MTTRMTVGALRHRVVLEQRETVPDNAGGGQDVFTPLAAVWAQIEPAAARRRGDPAAPFAGGEYRLRLRLRTDVCPGMRVLWARQILEILQVAPLTGERRFMELRCREIGDDA